VFDASYGTLACSVVTTILMDRSIADSIIVGEEPCRMVNQDTHHFEWMYMCYVAYYGAKEIITADFACDMAVVCDDRAKNSENWMVTNDGNGGFTPS
jgi:hypothetical protein